jgi:hypothetical protein
MTDDMLITPDTGVACTRLAFNRLLLAGESQKAGFNPALIRLRLKSWLRLPTREVAHGWLA